MSDGAGTNVKFATQPYQHRNIGWRFGDGVAANVHSLFRRKTSESGFIANVGYDDENNISDARVAARRDALPHQSEVARVGRLFAACRATVLCDGRRIEAEVARVRSSFFCRRKRRLVRNQ